VLAVNVTGAYNCIRAVLPEMRARKDGVIVNIGSVAGLRAGVIGGAAYNASKFGLTALGRTVAVECRDEGIRVTNVYPGEVETPILDDRPVPVLGRASRTHLAARRRGRGGADGGRAAAAGERARAGHQADDAAVFVDGNWTTKLTKDAKKWR
jgi:NAD(P)-dependent dehydrogenase (short-subunit alcohol dehydrogenase family)